MSWPADTLEETLAELLAAGAPGALALAVGPWGRSQAANGLEASAQFEIGSVAKTFVAALTLLLVEDEVLGLDESVAAYLPPRFEAVGPATVRSLLNHTSGLPDFFEDVAFAATWQENPGREWDPEELLEISLALPRHEPGVFRYANSNYVVVALAIEAVTERAIGEMLRRRILDPHGLTATVPATATVPGALISSADDVANFLAALLAGEIVEESSLREMLTPVPSDWEESQGYGLGIEQVDSLMGFERSPCGSAWGHVGLGTGTTVAFATPDAERQVVLVANALLTSDGAWAALSRATWAVLCSDRRQAGSNTIRR